MSHEPVNPGIRGRYQAIPAGTTVTRIAALATIRPEARFCPCGNKLSVYNPGPSCNACHKAELDELLGGGE